jgi:TM2 domain-containing membrane protein YozV
LPKRRFRHYIVLAVLLLVSAVSAADGTSGRTATDSGTTTSVSGKTWNPLVTGGLSAVLPGAGQVYTGHYIKAGAFLALEAITASVASFWYRTEIERNNYANSLERQSLQLALNKTDSLAGREEADLWRFDAYTARYSMYNVLAWMISGYVYNVLDAIGCSRHFVSDSEKNPARAAWLSAIPGLGLGQLYNGAPGKAGMVLMVQTALGVKAVNEHRLMRKAESHITAIQKLTDSTAIAARGEFKSDWEYRQGVAFRNRNSYLWYSLFFYVYGILDAVVDAHLHDYPKKMRAYPDLLTELSAAGITVEYNF